MLRIGLVYILLVVAASYAQRPSHTQRVQSAGPTAAASTPSPSVQQSPISSPIASNPGASAQPSLLTLILGVLGTIALAIIGRVAGQFVLDWLQERRTITQLEKDPHTIKEIKDWAADRLRTYVEPDCQDTDPTDESESEQRRPVFQELDELLGPPPKASCILILADSGMGKSSLLHKYYGYHWMSSKRSNRFKLVVVPLNRRNSRTLLERVPEHEKGETVLFLDGLDEDREAIDDYETRLLEIAKLTTMFACVVITCRTQFFLKDADILIPASSPQTSYSQGFGEPPPITFKKLYLSPFSSSQTAKYLKLRFLWRLHPVTYWRAIRTAERFTDFVSRPMLLTYIQNLVQANEDIKFSFELYEVIVSEWLRWEVQNKLLAKDATQLLEFSHKFAGHLFVEGRNRASIDELRATAKAFSVDLDVEEVRQRSLLNRDVEGNWKFAHRSVQEYLLVRECSIAAVTPAWTGPTWTDQMRQFAKEMILSGKCQKLLGADFRGENFAGLKFGPILLTGVRLDSADLSGASLETVSGLTAHDVLAARVDKKTCWPVRKLRPKREGWISSSELSGLGVSPRGDYIVTATSEGALKIWDIQTGEELRRLTSHKAAVKSCAVSSDGTFIVSASADQTLKIWDAYTGKELHTLIGHTDSVQECAISPKANYIVSASWDGTLKLWELESGCELLTIISGHDDEITACAIGPMGDYVVSGSRDRTLKVWQTETGRELRTLTGHANTVESCAISPKGDYIVSASWDRTLKMWDFYTGNPLHTLVGHTHWVEDCAISPQGNYIVSASADSRLKIWDPYTGMELLTLRDEIGLSHCEISSNGNFIVSASFAEELTVWFPPTLMNRN